MDYYKLLGIEKAATQEEIKRAYEIAARLGVKDFVVPGNRPEKIVEYRKLIESFTKEPVFYSPGMITQGGSLTDGAKAAGKRWHAIVGRALYQAKDSGRNRVVRFTPDLWKDDKSWNYIVITKDEYPRVETVRQHELKNLQEKRKWDIEKAKNFISTARD